jgi:hypothetical protein
VGGREALELPLPNPGPFSLSLPLGGTAGQWEVAVVPERTFCPREHGPSDDGRRLGVQLLRLRARTRDGREIVKRLGPEPGPGHRA